MASFGQATRPARQTGGATMVMTPRAAESGSTEQQQQTQESLPTVLRLHGAPERNDRSVQWAEDVVDNEGLNRKSSKVCCIYHRPRAADESSDSDSSSSDSDSDASGPDAGDADHAYRSRPRPLPHRHAPDCPENGQGSGQNDHGHDHDHDHDHDDKDSDKDDGNGPRGSGKSRRRPSPNAYEKMPRYDRPAKPSGSGGA